MNNLPENFYSDKEWEELIRKAFSKVGIELPRDFSFDKKEDIIALRNKVQEESIQKSFSKIGVRMKTKTSDDNSITFENDTGGTEIKLYF